MTFSGHDDSTINIVLGLLLLLLLFWYRLTRPSWMMTVKRVLFLLLYSVAQNDVTLSRRTQDSVKPQPMPTSKPEPNVVCAPDHGQNLIGSC